DGAALAAPGILPQKQLHFRGVFGINREVDSRSVPRGALRIGFAGKNRSHSRQLSVISRQLSVVTVTESSKKLQATATRPRRNVSFPSSSQNSTLTRFSRPSVSSGADFRSSIKRRCHWKMLACGSRSISVQSSFELSNVVRS